MRDQMKAHEYILIFLSTLMGGGAALLVFSACVYAPLILYKIESPSAVTECGRIHPGTNINEVKAAINRVPPYHQTSTNGQLMFVREDATCTVRFDPATGNISEVKLTKSDLKMVN